MGNWFLMSTDTYVLQRVLGGFFFAFASHRFLSDTYVRLMAARHPFSLGETTFHETSPSNASVHQDYLSDSDGAVGFGSSGDRETQSAVDVDKVSPLSPSHPQLPPTEEDQPTTHPELHTISDKVRYLFKNARPTSLKLGEFAVRSLTGSSDLCELQQ